MERNGDKMVAWLREAADEIEKAHALLDDLKVPRGRSEGIEMTLAARISTLHDIGNELAMQLERHDLLEWSEDARAAFAAWRLSAPQQ